MLCMSHRTTEFDAYGGIFTPNKWRNSLSFICCVIITAPHHDAVRCETDPVLYTINVTLVRTVGCRVCRALSLPTCRVLTSTAALSKIHLTIIASVWGFSARKTTDLGRCFFPNIFRLPKMMTRTLIIPRLPRQRSFFGRSSMSCSRKQIIQPPPVSEALSGSLCWAAGQRRNDIKIKIKDKTIYFYFYFPTVGRINVYHIISYTFGLNSI